MEGNNGEDVKELFYYLDSTPTHSYMKMLYKYPQAAFPYQILKDENNRRGRTQQADGTSWMAMFALNMLHISLELALKNETYIDMVNKFFEHFLYIAGALDLMGEAFEGLWNDEDEFYYDQLHVNNNECHRLNVRSMVSLIPFFAVEVPDRNHLLRHPAFAERMNWFLKNRPDVATLVSHWNEQGKNEKHLLSLLRGHRMKRLLSQMLDENEF